MDDSSLGEDRNFNTHAAACGLGSQPGCHTENGSLKEPERQGEALRLLPATGLEYVFQVCYWGHRH